MLQAILFDLDDTLLGNHVDTFMKQYFALLSAYARPIFDEATFLPMLIQATRAMIRDTDPTRTNAEVFWESFEGLTGGRRAELEPFFARFYETEFEQLRAATVLRPAAATLVRNALDQGLSVVIATNPLFPRPAIERRLEWAGIPVTEYPYALVTTYENMHAAKPQAAYYREILSVIDSPPEQALMVGDDWNNDIAPAAAVGLHTWWIATDQPTPDPALIRGRSTLEALAERVAGSGLNGLIPSL